MKKIILIIVLLNLICHLNLIANKINDPNKKYDFYLNIGLSYISLGDYIGGPALGLSLSNPNKKLGFLIRSDYLMSFGKSSYVTDTIGTVKQSDGFGLIDYKNLLYFDIEYNLTITKKNPVIAGLGIGWIFLGDGENTKFNSDYGYTVLSPKIIYKYSWISFELRGNIPIQDLYFKRHNHPERLFPIEMSIIYRFNPKKRMFSQP